MKDKKIVFKKLTVKEVAKVTAGIDPDPDPGEIPEMAFCQSPGANLYGNYIPGNPRSACHRPHHKSCNKVG